MNFSTVANTVGAPAYQQTASSNPRSTASTSNIIQTVGRIASDVAVVAAAITPVVGLLGGIIDIFV
ncbi:hypothetical protein PQQ51_18550 [Paraburkholderia xenovorans]|uniref:hypothetical protein n=1 Tax=Paraburkholderia xenovorans TaxID=36873 RepID=UPI0038B7DE64